MQDFGTKTDDTAGPGGQLSAAEFNNLATENENAVLRSGQALSGASTTQLASSLFLHAVKAQTFQDSGVINAYVCTPISGLSGVLLPSSYAAMDGARISFIAASKNGGDSTLNIGQTTGTLLGIKKILTMYGEEIPSGSINAGEYIQLQYDSSLDSAAGAWRQIKSSVGGGLLAFDVAGVTVWSVPLEMQLGIIKPHITVVGGGGGGSRIDASAGGGGGGGGAGFGIIDLTGVTSVTVTVGAAGLGATVSGVSGTQGGTSSFGAYISATGGQFASGASGTGGTGGIGSGGTVNATGGVGLNATQGTSAVRFSAGHGGSSAISGGGRGSSQTVNTTGDTGLCGSGGAGGVLAANAGNGGAGVVLIQW